MITMYWNWLGSRKGVSSDGRRRIKPPFKNIEEKNGMIKEKCPVEFAKLYFSHPWKAPIYYGYTLPFRMARVMDHEDTNFKINCVCTPAVLSGVLAVCEL